MFKVSTEYDEYEIEFRHNPPQNQFIQQWKCGDISDEDFRLSFGTKCTIHNITTNVEIEEWSELNPKDQYCRNKGRKIALAKAMKFAFFDRETRKLFWDAYFKARGGKW